MAKTAATTKSTQAPQPKPKVAEDAHQKAAAHTPLPPLPRAENPPEQPKMTPAKQVPGATSDALDPEDLPANRRNPHNIIRVQAKAIGYYDDVIRRVGDVFDIADEAAFSDKWMRRVSPRTPERITGSNAALERAKKGEPVNEAAEEPRGGAGGDVLGS